MTNWRCVNFGSDFRPRGRCSRCCRCRVSRSQVNVFSLMVLQCAVAIDLPFSRGEDKMIKNPVPWPNGARCAVVFTWDMDSDSILHLAHPNDADTRLSTNSMLRYGPQIGVPRIVELCKSMGVKQAGRPVRRPTTPNWIKG